MSDRTKDLPCIHRSGCLYATACHQAGYCTSVQQTKAKSSPQNAPPEGSPFGVGEAILLVSSPPDASCPREALTSNLVARLRESCAKWRRYSAESLSDTNRSEWLSIADLAEEAATALESTPAETTQPTTACRHDWVSIIGGIRCVSCGVQIAARCLPEEPRETDLPRQRYSVTGRFIPLSENGIPQNALEIVHEATHDVYICDDGRPAVETPQPATSNPSYEFLKRENARLRRGISAIYSRSAKRSPAHQIAHGCLLLKVVDEWSAVETTSDDTRDAARYRIVRVSKLTGGMLAYELDATCDSLIAKRRAEASGCTCGHDGPSGPGHQMNCPQWRAEKATQRRPLWCCDKCNCYNGPRDTCAHCGAPRLVENGEASQA